MKYFFVGELGIRVLHNMSLSSSICVVLKFVHDNDMMRARKGGPQMHYHTTRSFLQY